MSQNSQMLPQLDSFLEQKKISLKLYQIIQNFHANYRQAISNLPNPEKNWENFDLLIKLILEHQQNPHQFSIFHRSIRKPFDYYQFGLDFFRPFIDFKKSKINGLDALQSIQTQLKNGENVVLLANHQIEPDPQVLSLLLEKIDPRLAEDMIIFAGHRVLYDPMAVPMSLGCNLLCIYSKKHISYPPEEKANKIQHNQRTLKQLQVLLNEGGHCIYVAPSGGRDRPDAEGKFAPAPFDPQSVELFWLLGQQAERPTHFYPLALLTHHLMPPPTNVEKELGEKRTINFTPVYLAFGDEVDMNNFPESENLDKKSKRDKRASYIWERVCECYMDFPKKLT